LVSVLLKMCSIPKIPTENKLQYLV